MPTRKTHAISLLLPMLAPACTEVTAFANADHCALNEGDRYCAELFPDKPYCIQGQGECSVGDKYGCVEQVMPECHAPCGILGEAECMAGSSSGTDSGSSSESGSESGSESSTTGPMPCVGNEDCADATAPLCEPVSGECVACDAFGAEADAACAGLEPEMPVCVGGACVQCTAEAPEVCTGMTPLCDDATNTCVPCTEHGQCGEAACNLFTGACLPAAAVVRVGGAMPDFATITAAVASFDMMAEGTIIVHAGGSYDESITVDGGRVLAFLAADLGPMVMPPRWTQTGGGSPQLTVGDATVLMDGMQLSSNSDDVGLLVDGGRAWVGRGRIVQNTGGGIVAQNGAELTLRNNFVTLNGGAFADTRALTSTNATLMLSYNTIAANSGTGASGPISMSCDAGTGGEVRNSIVAAGTDTIACTGLSFDHNVVDTGGLTGSNNDVLSFDPGWFPGIAMSDFHIAMGAPFANVAQWQTGDPTTDIDGDLRPTVDGTADYAGADVP